MIRFTPVMEPICSSTGLSTSLSTTSGDAPGYTMPTVRNSGFTSGNSSVFNVSSANVPKITSVSMATTVINGRLIAKSEIIIWREASDCGVRREPLVFAGVRRRAHFHGRLLRDTCRRAKQQRVPRLYPGAHLDGLRRRIANPKLDLCLLNDAVLEQHHVRLEPSLVHGRERDHRRIANFARHVAVREQTAHERAARVWQRHDDPDLPGRRIGDRIDARDVTGELPVGVAVHREVHGRSNANGR